MGTRSLIHFKDDNTILCTVYRQFDGYPEGRGKELADFLLSGRLVNGIPMDSKGRVWNGMGCLAAQWIAHEKGDDAGGVYMREAGASDFGEEYTYEISGSTMDPERDVSVSVIPSYGDDGFSGSPESFARWIAALEVA